MRNPEYFSDLCRSIYYIKRLDRSEVRTLRVLYQLIKGLVENGDSIDLRMLVQMQKIDELDIFILVQMYIVHNRDNAIETKTVLDTTSLYIIALQNIIVGYAYEE